MLALAAPFGPPRLKAIKKSQKLYFWDWSPVGGEAARLGNLVMTVLHQVLSAHFREFQERADEHGGLPRFVEREVASYLCRGLMAG